MIRPHAAPLALCLVLAAGDLWLLVTEVGPWFGPAAAIERKNERVASDTRQEPEAEVLPPRETYAETSRRPLFTPTRRPTPIAVQAAPEVPAQVILTTPLPPLVLIGTMTTDGARLALFKSAMGGGVLSLTENQLLENWRLVSITPGRALFRQGDTEQELSLPPGQGIRLIERSARSGNVQ